MAICIEQTRGAVVYALMKYEFITIFPLPPARLANYRKSVTSSGAKDDPSDANLIWDYLVRHPDRLTPWKPDDPLTREIGPLVEARRDAVNLRTQLANQLIATLKGYFPQAISLVGNSVHSPMACAFLSKWTTSDQLAKARPRTVREFYYAHNSRYHSPWAKAFYQSQRAKGKAHHTAVRALAFKWLRILYRCWKTRTPYNENAYLDALKRRNSPLLQYLDHPLAPCA